MTACSADPKEDIGHGVTVERRYVDGQFAGFAYWHPCKTGNREAWIPLNHAAWSDPSFWNLQSAISLTVDPSLLCPICGHHGFVSEGKWVPA